MKHGTQTYSEWLIAQAPERQVEALEHRKIAKAFGEAQRAGNWREADRLSLLLRAYYEKLDATQVGANA